MSGKPASTRGLAPAGQQQGADARHKHLQPLGFSHAELGRAQSAGSQVHAGGLKEVKKIASATPQIDVSEQLVSAPRLAPAHQQHGRGADTHNRQLASWDSSHADIRSVIAGNQVHAYSYCPKS